MSSTRTWLITGASSGLGLELARLVIRRGDFVIVTSRTPEKIPTKDLDPDRFFRAKLDQSQPLDDIKNSIDRILDAVGPIDIVVNNAAYVQFGTVEEATPQETIRQFQVNTLGPINVYRAVLPQMRKRRTGTLITIGSMAAWYTMPACNLYNASKAALRVLALGLADELKQFNIHHCLVEPGFFRTALIDPSANIANSTVRLPDYNDLNLTAETNLSAFNGIQLGNPVKGAEVIYDVVTSTGCAVGRELPRVLALGSDASLEIAKAANLVLAEVDGWKGVSSLTDFPS